MRIRLMKNEIIKINHKNGKFKKNNNNMLYAFNKAENNIKKEKILICISFFVYTIKINK